LRARNFRHGGAFLLTPEPDARFLDIKYGIEYPRLHTALVARGKADIARTAASDQIFEYLESDADELPMLLHLDESVEQTNSADIESEIDGAIWFVALLSRVDGLVLMNMDLEVRGFGVVITADALPREVCRARDPAGLELEPLDYDHYGTRHRSMMRYCGAVPGSIGFVVSQDGDVRVMTSLEGRLVMWDNVRLQFHDFAEWEEDHPQSAEASEERGGSAA
jgi:hypothetical protein